MYRFCLLFLCLICGTAGLASGQDLGSPSFLPPPPDHPVTDHKLPNGKSQREEILKADFKKSLSDAAELSQLADELKSELEKGSPDVVSVKSLRQLEQIEKLAKRIRGRLKRY
jgi:hypothetical protein